MDLLINLRPMKNILCGLTLMGISSVLLAMSPPGAPRLVHEASRGSWSLSAEAEGLEVNEHVREARALEGMCIIDSERFGFGRKIPAHFINIVISPEKLTAYPSNINIFTGIIRLTLAGHRLTEISAQLFGLSQLKTLDLSNNQITTIPPDFCTSLRALDELDLSNNQIAEVPEALGLMAALTFLQLNNNRLTTIPNSVIDLAKRHESVISLQGNPLSDEQVQALATLAASIEKGETQGYGGFLRVSFDVPNEDACYTRCIYTGGVGARNAGGSRPEVGCSVQ
jgi:hypothetical protein